MPVSTQPFAGTFVADPAHSSFGFSVKHMQVASFSARFEDVDARFAADERGVRLEGAVRVESVSIKNPPEFREHVVYGGDFFDARNHPEIAFRSSRVELGEDGSVRVEGELAIKGITKSVTATGTYQPPVEDPFGSVRTALELAATIDRRDWNMDWQMPLPGGGNVLGYSVRLSAHIEFIKES